MHIASTTLQPASGRLWGIILGFGLLASGALANTGVPFISFTDPPSANPGGGNLTLKVHGTAFQQSSVVNWGVGATKTALATTYVSNHELDATVPSGLLVDGTASVTIASSGSSGARTSNPIYFPVHSSGPPIYTQVQQEAGNGPGTVAVGDFNNDGIPDLAVINSLDGSVQILLGKGDGSFISQPSISLPSYRPTALAVGDFNNDGNLDLAVGFPAGAFSIYLGLGNGSFNGQVTIYSGFGTDVLTISVGDFDQDGNLDVFVSTSNQGTLAYGDGQGGITSNGHLLTGATFGGAAIGDFNGDGYLDFGIGVSFEGFDGSIVVYLEDPSGQANQAGSVSLGPHAPVYLAIADFNRDGIADWAVPGIAGSDGTGVYPGYGNGHFENSPPVYAVMPALGIAAADMNGDGLTDVVVGGISNTLSVTLQHSGGTFDNETQFALPSGTLAGQVVVADFNGDGILDILVGNQSGNTLTLLLSGPGATLSPASLGFAPVVVGDLSSSQTITLSSTGSRPLQIASITATGDFQQTNNCGATLALGSTCTITVTFAPTTAGSRQGWIVVTDNNGGISGFTQSIPLSGTGIADDPIGQLSTPSVFFGDQFVGTTSNTSTVFLTVGGNYALAISSIGTTGDFAQTNNCPASLALGSSCNIHITFTPTATGARSGTLVIIDNNGGVAGTQTISLSGTGDSIETASLSAGSLSYLSQAVNTSSATQSVTLTNTAQGVLGGLLISGIATSGSFSQTNNCAPSLSPGASCTIQVTFTPTAEGSVSGTLTITDNSGGTSGSTQHVSLIGYGRPAPATYATPYVSGTSRLSAQPGANAFELGAQLSGHFFTGDLDWRVGSTVTKLTANNNSVHIPQHLLANAGTATLTFVNPNNAPANGASNPILFPIATKRAAPIFSSAALAGERADTVAVGDFNGDGLDDIVFSNPSKLEVLLGDGQGNFHAAAKSSPVGATALALGDFNGDGKLDVAAAIPGGLVAIALGKGDGTFAKPIVMSYNAQQIATADLNGDGYLDLVLVSTFNPVQILLGNGDGTFGPGVSFSLGSNEIPNGLRVGNLGGPVGLDLLVLTANHLFTYYGKGDGTFTAGGATSSGGYALAVGPFFGAGLTAAAIVTSTGIAILESDGGGSWVQPGSTIPVSGHPEWLAAADFNGDGKLDLAALSPIGGAVTLLLGDGQGNLTADSTVNLTGRPSQLAIGDFNGDGRLDLASNGSSISTLIQPPFEVSAGNLHFQTTGGLPSRPQTLRLKNTGTQALIFSSVTVTGAKASEFSTGLTETCSAGVAAGATCTVTITYTPGTRPENSVAQLVLTGSAGTQQIGLKGRSK